MSERWTPKKKRAVVRGIIMGKFLRREAIEKYGLSVEEIEEWMNKYSSHCSMPRLSPRVIDGYRP